jgi:hypothetical protein
MLRQSGQFTGGPAAFAKADRSRFLAKLDEVLHALRRERRGRGLGEVDPARPDENPRRSDLGHR